MSNIPQARTRLHAVCDNLERFWPKGTRKVTAALIRQIIADDMHKTKRVAETSPPPDPVLRAAILKWRDEHPSQTSQKIAAYFNINVLVVSEAILWRSMRKQEASE